MGGEHVALDGAPRMTAELHADFIGRAADLEEGQAVPGFTQHAASLNMRPQLTCCMNSRSLGFSGVASSSAGGPSTAILPSSLKISRVPTLRAKAISWVTTIRSEQYTSELQSLMRTSHAAFSL